MSPQAKKRRRLRPRRRRRRPKGTGFVGPPVDRAGNWKGAPPQWTAGVRRRCSPRPSAHGAQASGAGAPVPGPAVCPRGAMRRVLSIMHGSAVCAGRGVGPAPSGFAPGFFAGGRCSALASIMQRSTSPRVGRVGACHTGLLFPAVCGRRCSAGSFGLAACHILNCRGQGTPGSGAAVTNRAQCGSSNRSRSGAHRRWLERSADCRLCDPGPFQGVRRSGGAPNSAAIHVPSCLEGGAGRLRLPFRAVCRGRGAVAGRLAGRVVGGGGTGAAPRPSAKRPEPSAPDTTRHVA